MGTMTRKSESLRTRANIFEDARATAQIPFETPDFTEWVLVVAAALAASVTVVGRDLTCFSRGDFPMRTVMILAINEEGAWVSTPSLDRDGNGTALSVAVFPLMMRAARNGRLKSKVMSMLSGDYDVFVVVGMGFKLFGDSAQRLKVADARVVAFDGRSGEVYS
jgi:hypothetical protein